VGAFLALKRQALCLGPFAAYRPPEESRDVWKRVLPTERGLKLPSVHSAAGKYAHWILKAGLDPFQRTPLVDLRTARQRLADLNEE
jgi:hypothetical protein